MSEQLQEDMKADGAPATKFRFSEDKVLSEAMEYIRSTYGQHYVAESESQEKIQVIDMWEAAGGLEDTLRNTAIKYLVRYGKKAGHNPKDLLKTIHYTVLLYHFTLIKGKQEIDPVANEAFTEALEQLKEMQRAEMQGGVIS